MKIVIHEFLKIALNKRILLIFLGLLLFNGALLYIDERDRHHGYEPAAYRDLYESIEGMSNEAALQQLEREYEEIQALMEISFTQGGEAEASLQERFPTVDIPDLIDRFQSGDFLRYTDSHWSEQALYRLVLDEVKQVLQYGEYLVKMDEDAKRMTSVSIFSKPGTFSYRNIKKTPRDFDHLRENELSIGPSAGVQMATQFSGTDLIAVLFLIVIAIQLVTKEKETRSLGLIKTTYKGRGTLALAKLGVMGIWSFLLLAGLYGVNFALAYSTYGFGDVGRFIQSVYGYMSSPFDITVLEYFILFLVVKLAVYLFLSLLFFLITVIARNSMAVYVVIAFVFGLSGILYVGIAPTSIFVFFKYINLVHYLRTYTLFSNYVNLNIFGYPVQYAICFVVITSACSLLFFILSYQIFCKQKYVETKSRLSGLFKSVRLFPLGEHVSIFLHEMYKLFVANKVWIILVLAIAFQYFSYQPHSERFADFNEVYYKRYMLQLEGEKTEEKEAFLAEEGERFHQLQMEMMELLVDEENAIKIAVLSEQLVPLQAFEQVVQHANYLSELEADRGIKGWFLYDVGYKKLTAAEGNMRDLQLALLAVVMLIACLTPLFTYEMQTRMIRVVSPTRHGREKLFYMKLVIGLGVVLFIYGLVYVPEIVNILSAYGTRALNAPVASMPHLKNVPVNMSIGQYLIVLSMIRFLGVIFTSLIVYVLSVRLKSIIVVALASTGVLVLPLLLAMLGIQLFDYVGLTPVLLGNVPFKEYGYSFLESPRNIWGAVGLVLFLVVFVVAFRWLRAGYVRYRE